MKPIVREFEKERLKADAPAFGVGDTVKVFAKIKEGDKERIQSFEGIVIAKKGGSFRETFTVRRIVQGVGVERIFPIHSPKVDRVTVVRRGSVRRSKLFYLRGRVGTRATRVAEQGEQ